MKNCFKRWLSVLMLTLLLTCAITAVVPAMAQTVRTSSVSLNMKGTVKLDIGATLQISATLSPANSTQGVRWTSSKRAVATVSATGLVTGRRAGYTTITAKSGVRKAIVRVKVVDPTLPTSVRLDKSGTVRIPIYSTLTLNPTLSPATAKSGFTWKSSKKKVATVKNGVITARKTGTTTIMVTTRNKKKAKVKVRVYDPYLPTSIRLSQSGTQTVPLGKTLTLTATMSPNTAQSGLKWKTSSKNVVHVNNGVIYPQKPGTATVSVTTRNGKKATVKIRVVDNGDEPITTQPGYNLPYVIYACKNTHTIAILARDGSGAWNRVIRKFPTGTGVNNSTDVGTFFITKKERWHSWGNGYSPYANKLSVGIFLHGPIYKSKNFNSIKVSYYNHIGTDTSSGCLRTICGCAAWVYYNCPVGTQVIIRNNSRFSEPKQAKLKSTATSDPTDPGANPEILITGFSASPSKITLEQGKSQTISISGITPSNNSTGRKFTFSTGNASVATVSASGVVTGVGQGTTSITIVAGDDFKATVRVPVTVSGGIIAGAEPVTNEKLAEDETPAESAAVERAPAEETAAEEAAVEPEAAEAEVAAETEEAAGDVTAAPEEEIISGTEEELAAEPEADPEPETPAEDNGLTIETEDLAEEQAEIIIEEE